MLSKKTTWVMALLLVVGGALLSWPFHADHGFWAESPAMWLAYVIAGGILGLYVAAIFIHVLATLIYHEAECCKPVAERMKPSLND